MNTPSPYGFALLDLDNDGAVETMYVGDDRTNVNGGGVQKWKLVAGTWVLTSTFAIMSNGARGVAAVQVGSLVYVIAGTNEATMRLVYFVDDGVNPPAATQIAVAGMNTAFRGVALAPK
jgi:hypothetical protein